MEIEDYEERKPHVVALDGPWLEIFVGDAIPGKGDAIEVTSPSGDDEIIVAVTSHTGGRTVRALAYERPEWLAEGCPIRTGDVSAVFPEPTRGSTETSSIALRAGEERGVPFHTPAPDFSELRTERPALQLGLDGIDRLTPVARSGHNLVLDNQPGRRSLDVLGRRTHDALPEHVTVWVSVTDLDVPDWVDFHIDGRAERAFAAHRLAMSWVQALSDAYDEIFVVVELPPLQSGSATDVEIAMGVSIGDVIDQLGSAFTSTNSTSITSLVWLPLSESPEGLETIIETMGLGDVDAQIFVDEDGKFEPMRSTSDADLDEDERRSRDTALELLQDARNTEEKKQMFGESEVSPEERETLEEASRLHTDLSG